MATKTKKPSVKKLTGQLGGLITKAKGLGIDTGKAEAMVAQTKRQGGKSFAGSEEEKAYKSGVGTGVTAPPAETPTPPGVISSTQGEDTFKKYQEKQKQMEAGLGTIDSPLSDAQVLEYEKQGYREGDTVPGKGRLTPGGYFEPETETKQTDYSATYIDPNTEASVTTTGAGAGSEEEQKKMKEKGYEFAEGTTGAMDTKSPELKEAEDAYNAAVQEVNTFKNKLADMFITDSELRADVRAITKAYDARIAEMQEITSRQVKSINTLGIRMGSQFTGGMGGVWGGIISDAERQGLMKVADLEGQKQTKIIEAKSAARDFNFKLYAELMDDAQAIQKEKAAELSLLKEEQRKKDKEIADKKIEMSQQDAIIGLYQQGIKDPALLFDYANRDEQGNLVGGVTMDTIDKALKMLNPPDALEGLDQDYRTFAYLQSINDPAVRGLKYTDYVSMMQNLKRAPTTSTESERKTGKLARYAQVITVPGAQYDLGNGQYDYITGEDGYISPRAWKTFITDAQENGITREEFIGEFGYLLNPVNTDYAVTAKEKEIVFGKPA